MTLGDLIAALKKVHPDKTVQQGFAKPDSYRGFYEECAFEPAENVTIESMLAYAESALGTTFEGYKGGDYVMDEFTDCWISTYGEASGDKISRQLVWYWSRA